MKIICVGRNYVAHIDELGNGRPDAPVVFMKPDSAVLPKKAPFYLPYFSKDIHHEIELLVKISKPGKYIDAAFAHRYYNEVGLGLDFTARDIQEGLIEKSLPWEISKGFDGSAVIGKFVPKEELNSLEDLSFSLEKNDEVVQEGSTNMMIWKIDEIIAYVSQFFTLKKGDIIFTGTPEGVSTVVPNDRLVGYLEGVKVLNVTVK